LNLSKLPAMISMVNGIMSFHRTDKGSCYLFTAPKNPVTSSGMAASRQNATKDAWSCHPDRHTKFQGQSLAQHTWAG